MFKSVNLKYSTTIQVLKLSNPSIFIGLHIDHKKHFLSTKH